jgi:hypothetical protein
MVLAMMLCAVSISFVLHAPQAILQEAWHHAQLAPAMNAAHKILALIKLLYAIRAINLLRLLQLV